MAEPGNRRPLVITLAGIAVAIVGGAVWWMFRPLATPAPPAAPGPISATDASRLLERRNAGIGQLENGSYEGAATIFERIIAKLPDDLLGHRNLAVARVLAVQDLMEQPSVPELPQKIVDATQAAERAIASLKKAEPNSAIPHLLAVRIYRILSEKSPGDEAIRRRLFDELSAGLAIDDQSVHLWYEQYQALDLQFEEESRRKARDALKRAFQLRPNNLALISAGLLAQAENRDPDLVQNLDRVKQTLKPVAIAILKRDGRFDLLKTLDSARELLKQNPAGNWPAVRSHMFLLRQLIIAEHAKQLDVREIQPHELEFVIADFNPDFYKRVELPAPRMPPAIPVQMKPAAGPWKLPDLQQVKAIKLADFDLDGRVDLIVARDKAVQVYGFNANRSRWELLCEKTLPFQPHGLAVADLDDDIPLPQANLPGGAVEARKPRGVAQRLVADVDIVAFGPAGVITLRNTVDPKTAKRTLQEVKQPNGFPLRANVLAVAIADLDHDSDLDLVVSTTTGLSLWMNRGDMTFEDVSEHSTLPPATFRPTTLIPIDFNRDVHIDIVLADPKSETAGYLENIRHGQFRFTEFRKEFSALGHAQSLSPNDADGNVSWDWIAAGKQGVTLTQTRTVDHGRYQFLKSSVLQKDAVTAATLWDYDNDGYLDVLAWSPNGISVHRGGPNGQFQKTEKLFSDPPKSVVICDVADVDGDGDLDVVAMVDNGQITLFLNEGGNANNWIDITLHAEEAPKEKQKRCNSAGVGSLMELKSGPTYQPRIVTDAVTHFGIGREKTADVIRVLWTNGIPQSVLSPTSRQTIVAEQKLLKGSCPYLYTWTGEKYEFFTDCLWAAPIGLQSADGVLAPSRAEEFLKIPGERLVPVNGEYRVQITEELWEAGYFDSVKLYAIDHPADVEIFSNEKVGPAEIAKFQVHSARTPRLPIAARDQTGRDVLPVIARRDRRFLQAYSHRLVQGLTPEHFLELDLGKLKSPKRITLFLTGWVFPSDTSINVWLSHQTGLQAPQPPSLWVPDKKGEWKNVIPYMGFPGGKTKTIAVDLSKAFLTDDYRLRIKTTMELRWDAAFFTVDEAPVEHRITEIPVQQAELFYRGFSKRIDQPHHAPESYDFHTVDPQPHWPPMDGRFTRYGDVTQLLQTDDDRLVVLGAGDTMTVRFAVPKTPLPPGWKRDFFIRNVGWDKDADLNTVAGNNSEPLPFLEMPSYPLPPDVLPPDSPRYRDYLRTYQTRRQPAARFWRALGSAHP